MIRPTALAVLLGCLSGAGLPASAEPSCTGPEAAAAALAAGASLVLERVVWIRQGVFPEPAAQAPQAQQAGAAPQWLQRGARRWHRTSTQAALSARLLLRPGEPVDQARLAEAERHLRTAPYLHDARLRPLALCADRLVLEATTRDLWTLLPELNVGRSGGENSIRLGASDSNVLGSGKAVGLFYRSGVDRDAVTGFWQDPNVAGSRVQLSLSATEADDGGGAAVLLRRPFIRLDDTRAWGVSASGQRFIDGLSLRGERFAEFEHEVRQGEAFAGWSAGRQVTAGATTVRRWYAGWAVQEDRFAPAPDRVAPAVLAGTRRFSGPWVAVDMRRERWDTVANLDKIGITEDLDLGLSGHLRLGWSDPAFGGGGGGTLLGQASLRGARRLGGRDLLHWRLGVAGRWLPTADVVVDAAWRLRHRWSPASHLVVDGQWRWTRALSADRQVLLGGDSGLRGYPLRYQAGDRRWLLSVEQRWLGEREWFGLLRPGWAVFADAGRAWFAGGQDNGAFGVLGNLGVGLRLQSTRTEAHRVVHIDLARPLRDGPGVDGVQVLVTVRDTL